ncbi:probable disease resistance protein At4g27220 [Rosa chinensis]|nr:probable disease resistance protein At4g27220 [Rosa chinensis]
MTLSFLFCSSRSRSKPSSNASASASHPLPVRPDPQLLEDSESKQPKDDLVRFHFLKQPKPWITYTSSSKTAWKHDVFLSFRGEDTRHGFVSHLYDELESTGRIKTFKDDQGLQAGMSISPSLLRAIEESKLAIVVLSPNYASSPWCLDELTHIFQFMEGRDRILPIFYHVDPADVRHQRGSFATAFTNYERKSRQSAEKLYQWRAALRQVANISGWNTKNFGSESELVKRIAKDVSSKTTLEVQQRPVEIDITIPSTREFRIFESTRQAMDELIKALIDDEVTISGVYGMGGVGKTTMVRNVALQARKNGLFDHVIVAVVSQDPNVRRIQQQLAEQLDLRLEGTESETADRLKERIMEGKRILIILDDIWESIDLSLIGIPNPDELKRCNSKVLITTRRLDVCRSMKSQASFLLSILSKEDSWKLFVDCSRISFDESTNIYRARAIVRECGGLPVALKAIARALEDEDMAEWNIAVQQLRASQIACLDDQGPAFKCIKLGYDYLRSDDAKSFFLLCSLFPEDYDIPIKDLFKYAIGKGLLREAATIQEARDRANSVIKYLKASSLLLDSPKEGCVKMHDVVRDTAKSIPRYEDDHGFCVKAGCGLKEFRGTTGHGDCSAISLMMNDIDRLPEELVCPKLQILLLQNNVHIDEIPESFFRSSKALRVLDISFSRISSLPRSFSFLINLRALFLDHCNELVDISIFGNLKRLEILSMIEFPLKELPKEMGNLTNLRMLDLSGSYNIGIFPYSVLSRLCKLEELYMQCNSGNWGSKIHGGEETNVGSDKLIGLPLLNTVKLRISDAECLPKNLFWDWHLVTFDICISREPPSGDYSSEPIFSHDHSRTLTLNTTINSLPDWFINTVTEKAVKLQYLKCRGLKNILVEHNRGRLHGLKNLAVIGPHENLEVLMETITLVPNKPVFEKLEELHLLGVSCLKELCVGELPVGSLCNLKLFKVEYCHDLVKTLLPSNLWQRLHNMEKLICEDMNLMEYVFGSKGMESEDIILIKLREMILWNLENLIGICNGPAPNAVFHSLKSLAVYGCKKLKHLFTYDIAHCLLHLEDLSVTQCSSLDRVIEPSKETVNKKMVFPELKNLALSYLPQLTRFCSSESATIECPSLEHLHVQDCPHFTTSISDFHSGNRFIQVNDLRHLRMSKDLNSINLTGQHTMDILESLPHNVRKRVEFMREIESQRDELEAKLFKEKAELEAKYQKLYQNLYSKRYLIVNGVVETEGVATETITDHENKTAKERGVPDFWLNALKNNAVLAKEITECDEGALKYLRDVKCFKIHNSKGFKLEFDFDTNPFFKNSVLTKTYHMIDEDEPNSTAGTEIEWYPAKCLTQKIVKKKHKKGSKNSKLLTKTKNYKSFFNFFSPHQVSKDHEVIDEAAAEELKNRKKQDYDVGSTICYKIIPHAVSWYTGEAF